MRRHRYPRCFPLMVVAVVSTSTGFAHGQTSLSGSGMALRSSGSATMSATGYVGTYLVVPAGGATVNFTLTAQSVAGAGAAPHMNLVIADSVTGFSVGNTSATGYSTGNVALPAGTYFVRAERDYSANVGVSRSVTVGSLAVSTVSGSTATFSNSSSDANALAAATTYVDNFRKGSATVAITGPGAVPLLAGTPVRVDLGRHAFNFGTAVPGTNSTSVNAYLGGNGTVQQTSYQSRLNQNFNAVVPENMGKWSSNEGTRDFNSMAGVDTILNYAAARNMRARMHNVIWGSQQPNWVNTLLTNAATGVAGAADDLRTEISERIDYYVGTGAAGDRARKYVELDIYNESYHTGSNAAGSNNYWDVYGAAGIAEIHNEIAATVASHGAAAPKLFVNEYNVLQNMNTSYATWYSQHVETLRNAGAALGGIGIQYYPSPSIGAGNTQHSAARIASTLQNLSAHGVSLALTEFGVTAGGTQATAAQIMEDSMRLMFGTPGGTGFFMWGFQDEGNGNLWLPGAALYTVTNGFNTWTITEAGKAWQDRLGIQDWDGNPNNAWDTLVDAVAGAGGTISFNGFYGDYYLRGQATGAFDLTHTKGTTSQAVSMAAPPTWSVWNAATSGSWTTGGMPNTAGHTAYFGPAAAARSVTVSGNQTVGQIVLDSAVGSYELGGTGTLTLRGFGSANVAAIHVVAGSHKIGATLAFASPTSLAIAAGASLDITGNTLGLASPAALVRQYLSDGRLLSSTPDPDGVLTLGYLDTGTGRTVFSTYTGDANGDGVLNGDDYVLADRGLVLGGQWWWEGDFNYDGAVTAADILLLDATMGKLRGGLSPALLSEREARFGAGYVAALIANVPEPAGCCTAAAGVVAVCGRRRTRKSN